MMNTLDHIEKRLQSFIENNPLFSTWFDPKIRLANALVDSMEHDLVSLPDGTVVVPHQYLIRLSPGDYAYWQEHSVALKDLAEYIQSISTESGVHLRSFPTITLSEDARLIDGQISVEGESNSDRSFNTTALVPEPVEPRNDSSLPANAYLLYDLDQVFHLDKVMISIGRKAENDLVIDDPRVSRHHVQLRAMNGSFILFDLNSTGGTYVNDRVVVQKTLAPGDVISLAGITLIYVEDQSVLGSDTTQTKKLGYEPRGKIK